VVQGVITRSVLISVKEIYAQKIKCGEKRVELRRCFPLSGNVGRVYIYVSAPIKRIVGFFVVDKILRLPVDDLWEAAGGSSSLSKDEFYTYFSGKDHGVSVHFEEFFPLASNFSLEHLRDKFPRFHPPQSYIYLKRDIEDMLLGDDSKYLGIIRKDA